MASQIPISQKTLNHIERMGNKLPHPTMLFVWLCMVIVLCSWLGSFLGLSVTHPLSGEMLHAQSLVSAEGLRKILQNTVSNFIQFAPVGTVLVAMLGLGIAEQSGLLGTALRLLVIKAPSRLLTFIVVLSGVLSSLAADSGYVVLIPLAAVVFMTAGRHPIVGIAAAFAGVSGGFSANLMIGPIDAILAGISSEAVHIVEPMYEVSASGNYYFIVASTLLIAVLGSWVTEHFVAARFGEYEDNDRDDKAKQQQSLSGLHKQGLKRVLLFTLVFITCIAVLLIPENAALRNPLNGEIATSPFIKGIVTVIALYAGLAGIIFGKTTGAFSNSDSVIASMEKTMATMAGYLVLMFFAAQFVNYFAWSNLGAILAINGAQWLQALALPPAQLLLMFILFSASINLLIGSASAKWALLAPIFVPMFFLIGISPESTQIAFRVGDSVTNIITPLMPYFALVVAFVRQYDDKAGMGTIIAMMLPYSFFFLIAWSLLLLL